MKLMLAAILLLITASAAAETITATPVRLIQDDEGQKIIIEHEGTPQVVYLKKVTPNYDLMVDLLQLGAETKNSLKITLDEDFTRSVLSVKRK